MADARHGTPGSPEAFAFRRIGDCLSHGFRDGEIRDAAVPRAFPYPYRAMMAICSDLDETPDESMYRETVSVLNGTAVGPMGPGLGLEVGNTIYFDMPAEQFSYWNAGDRGRTLLRDLMRSGHIDCIHSFGDLATTRAEAERALEELERLGCRLKVWIDHATAPSNLGPDIMKGQGDVRGSGAYHADLTFAYGVEYVWMGRVTSVVGQDAPRRLGGIFDGSHPFSSGRTLAKEGVKGLLAETFGGKYAMHAGNRLLREVTLRDGRGALEFIRCNPHRGGVSSGETADGLGEVLTPAFLDRLEERGGICILYTHLGKARDRARPLRGETIAALRGLAARFREGRILVTTTRRVLDYASRLRAHGFRAVRQDEWTHLFVEDIPGERRACAGTEPPEGMTFYADNPEKTRVFFGGREIPDIRRNPPDRTGHGSVSIPWNPLRLPDLGAWGDAR